MDPRQHFVGGAGGLARERLERVGQVVPLPAQPVVLLPEPPHLFRERNPLGLERADVDLQASRILEPAAQDLHELVRLVRPPGHLIGHPAPEHLLLVPAHPGAGPVVGRGLIEGRLAVGPAAAVGVGPGVTVGVGTGVGVASS